MAGDEDKLEIVPGQAVDVRETRKLFRLTPAADNDVSRRQVAIVAADTEEETRQIALNRAFSGRIGAIRNCFRQRHGNVGNMRLRDVIFCSETLAAGKAHTRGEVPVTWTGAVLVRFQPMSISLSQLLEESFQIAWEYLDRTGELGDGVIASRFLSDTIEAMIRRGQRSRLALSNRAIAAYQRRNLKAGEKSTIVNGKILDLDTARRRIAFA